MNVASQIRMRRLARAVGYQRALGFEAKASASLPSRFYWGLDVKPRDLGSSASLREQRTYERDVARKESKR